MATGLCAAHYVKRRRANSPRCSRDGCPKASHAAGLCINHYVRSRETHRPRRACQVTGCPTAPRGLADAMCAKHKRKLERYGDPLWSRTSGKVWVDRQGYHMVYRFGRMRFVHRLVMEEKLGRPLTRGENVHHINGDKADNRPENLELWSKVQPSGQRVADKVAHALDVLRSYLPALKIDAGPDAAAIQAAMLVVERLRAA